MYVYVHLQIYTSIYYYVELSIKEVKCKKARVRDTLFELLRCKLPRRR